MLCGRQEAKDGVNITAGRGGRSADERADMLTTATTSESQQQVRRKKGIKGGFGLRRLCHKSCFAGVECSPVLPRVYPARGDSALYMYVDYSVCTSVLDFAAGPFLGTAVLAVGVGPKCFSGEPMR